MNTYSTAAQIKARSRGQLFGKYSIVVPAVLLCRMFLSWVTTFTGIGQDADTMTLILDCISLVLMIYLESVLNTGLANLFLNTICTGNVQVSDIFYGFRNGSGRYLWISAAQNLLPAIFLIPGMITLRRSLLAENHTVSLPAVLFLLLGLALYLILAVLLSQSYLIAVDFPSLHCTQCMMQSIRLMRVHGIRYICLILSFIPMFLLSALSLGVGQLFVTPYLETARANFYMELMNGGRD